MVSMVGFISPVVDIAIIAVVLVTTIQALQRKFVDRKKMKEDQKAIKEKQKKVRELMKKTDEKSKKEMEKLNKEVMESMSTMMQGSMRSMIISMAVIIPLWMFIGGTYANAIIALPFPIPFFSAFNWLDPGSWFSFKLYTETNWIGWYILISLSFSILLNIVLKIVEKVKGE